MATIIDLEHGSLIAKALDGHAERLTLYARYWDYYHGAHPMNYVSENFRKKYGSVFKSFADNLCRKVVDVPKARTLLERVQSEGEAADDWFRRQRLDGTQRIVHRNAFLFGDAYAILWDPGDGPRVYSNKPSMVVPVYDEAEPGRLLCAAKVWVVCGPDGKKKRMRVTVYYPDRAERFVTSGDSLAIIQKRTLEPFNEDGEPDRQEHGFGIVPVFHFANKAGPGEMGISELADAIPLQDALNKTVFDLLVNNEHISQAQRWATGIDVDIDPETGRPKNPFENRLLWTSGNEGAKFGQLPAGDSSQILAVCADFRQEISVVTGIPTYYLQRDASIPSGTALKVIEAPLRDKVEESQVLFGNVWEDLFAAALGIEVDQLNAVWKDTSPVSEGEELDNGLKKKALGISQKQTFRELGYTDDEIDQILSERSAEDRARVELEQRMMTRGGME